MAVNIITTVPGSFLKPQWLSGLGQDGHAGDQAQFSQGFMPATENKCIPL